MFKLLTVLTIVIAISIAEPLSRKKTNELPSQEDLEYSFSITDEDPAPKALRRTTRFIPLGGLNFIYTLIQHKISAITIVLTAIRYIATNVYALLFGGLISFAFCKITGKCHLNYSQAIPVDQYGEPEYQVAEEIFERALDRYKRENGHY